ncbi:hypothetical protein [Massilia sp. S19_KUP03_FR1]|uniref:hypothetical protein n=1 Tax=Massilia sp. S19_KUP03_FR1 TaxID=3025503 RepID=UPI002FCD8E17
MHTSRVNRRTNLYKNTQGETFDAAVVRQGMLLKLQVNTVSAIEYMKNRGISPAIIQRVLSGLQMRDDDKLAIATFIHRH